MSSRLGLLPLVVLRRAFVGRSQDGTRPEPWLFEVIADEITLPLAHLIEMAHERVFADGLGGQIQVLELVQLGPGRSGCGLGVRRSLAAGGWARRAGSRIECLGVGPGSRHRGRRYFRGWC